MFSGDNATHLPPSVKVWRKSHKAFISELLEKWRVYKAFSICGKLWKALKNELSINGACGDYCVDTKEKLVEVLYFRHFAKHFMFTSEGEKIRNQHLKNYFDVSVVVDIGCGNINGK